MTIRNKKELGKFLRAYITLFIVLLILFFQYSIPLYSNATCGSNICGPNCISMDPDTCTCFPSGCNGIPISSSTSGTVMCSTGQPICPIGQNLICPTGEVPCCIQFSNEAGCSNGLSCFGGSGFCGTSTTSSTSSSGNCQIICPPCVNSNPPCLFPCQIVCSSSSSSSSSGANVPFCLNGQIMCVSGTPACTSGSIPDCGSNYGLTNELAGQGCITQSMNFFFVGAAFCSLSQRIFLATNQIQTCENQESLCPTNRERFKYCREDKTSCRCICQFKTKNKSITPRCDNFNQPVCSGKLEPVCSKSSNVPVCLDGKLSCQDKNNSSIDFVDVVSCEKKSKQK